MDSSIGIPTPYIFDPASLYALIGCVFALVAVLIAAVLAPEEHRKTVRTILFTAFPLCVLFVIVLVVISPPQRQARLLPSPIAQSDELRRDLTAYRDEVQRLRDELAKAKGESTPAPPLLPPPSISNCNAEAAEAIKKMIARCGTHDICPKEIVLGNATEFEYHQMMGTLDHAALFFPTGLATVDITKDSQLVDFTRTFGPNTTAIIVSRASKTGNAVANRELSRKRAMFASTKLKELNPQLSRITLVSYGEETLYLTEHDAQTYSLDASKYRDVQHLNQSAFIFRFDCP